MSIKEFPTVPNVANVIAQIVDFAYDLGYDDENGKQVPPSDEVTESIAYVCACFLAQHAPGGTEGVIMELPLKALQIQTAMSFNARLEFAEKLVKEIGEW